MNELHLFQFFKRTTLYTHFNGEQYRTHRWKSTLKGRRSTACTLLWPTVGVYFSATCHFLACHSFEHGMNHVMTSLSSPLIQIPLRHSEIIAGQK